MPEKARQLIKLMEELQIEQRYVAAIFDRWMRADSEAELQELKRQANAAGDAIGIIKRIAAE